MHAAVDEKYSSYYVHDHSGERRESRDQSQACLSYAETKQSVRSDHLGSASWITDKGGLAVQHLQYLPYGERYVDQRISGYSERFTFTGKERDCETGLSYFGARYYDGDLSGLFLSVDPMADKYPSISPYAYCAWNPVKLVDPDGRKIRGVKYNENTNQFTYNKRAIKRGTDKYIEARIKTESGRAGIYKLMESKKNYIIRVTDKPIVISNGESLQQLNGQYLKETSTILVSTAEKISEKVDALLLTSEGISNYKVDPSKMQGMDVNSSFGIAAEKAGLKDFEEQYPYQDDVQRIHGAGAHEEIHALGNSDENAAIANEIKERLEYIKEVLEQ